MGLDKKTKEIEGHAWVVTQFAARPANKYKVRLVKMAGPAIAELLPAISGLGDDDVDGAAMLAIAPAFMSRIAQHVDEDVFVNTMVELMAFSTRDDVAITEEVFDIVFAGNDKELLQALWFIIQVNYPDFTAWVESRITGLRPKASLQESPEKPQPKSETSKG